VTTAQVIRSRICATDHINPIIINLDCRPEIAGAVRKTAQNLNSFNDVIATSRTSSHDEFLRIRALLSWKVDSSRTHVNANGI